MLDVHSNLANGTVCNTNYILKYAVPDVWTEITTFNSSHVVTFDTMQGKSVKNFVKIASLLLVRNENSIDIVLYCFIGIFCNCDTVNTD